MSAVAMTIVAGVVLTVLQIAAGGLRGVVVPSLCVRAGGSLVIPNTTAVALSRRLLDRARSP